MSILSLQSVSYSYSNKYQTVEALKDINCSFEQGLMYAIIGKSGSGKSTMLSLMAGLDLPDEGHVLYRGISTRTLDLDAYRRNDVAMIYQSFRLFPLLTAVENVMYPMELHGVRPRIAKKRAEEYIRSVGLPDTVFNRFPSMLSGGAAACRYSQPWLWIPTLSWQMSLRATLIVPTPATSWSCLAASPMSKLL